MKNPWTRLEPASARSALGKGLESQPDYEDAIHDFDYLASRLGEWRLLLDLVNGFLRHKVESEYCTVRDAILRANRALDKKGLVYFDVNRSEDRKDALARTIEICLDLLPPEERERYLEMVELPEDVDVPLPPLPE